LPSKPKPIDIDLLKGEISRRSLKEFVRHFWPVVEPAKPFVDGWHIDAICDHLAALSKREIRNLLINMPPRHCKSTLVAVIYPAWNWLTIPGEEYLFTSFKIDLATRDSVRCRRLIESDLFQKCFGSKFKLRDDQNTKTRFTNDKGGVRLVSSILGSGPTGEGGSIIAIDDPHSVEDKESDARRQGCVRWFDETFFNRLNSQITGCRLVVGQRIHPEDLSGHLLENQPGFWTHLCLPWDHDESRRTTTAIGWTDPRKIDGEPLWPAAWPESEIDQHRRKAQYFSAQFNQSPINKDNCLFRPEDFRYFEEDADSYKILGKTIEKKDCAYTIVSVDVATSQAKDADFTAIVTARVAKSGEIIVLDIVREKIPGPQITPRLQTISDLYSPSYFLIEDKGPGQFVIQSAREVGLPVRVAKAVGSKEDRSLTLQTRFSAQQVWFPKGASWLKTVEKEFVEFPESAKDDVVDAASHLANSAARMTRQSRSPAPAQQVPAQRSWEEIYETALMAGIQ
jgi:predicted phage terminase large subunit-like protein